MGFRPKRRIYVLDFAGTDLDGLVVKARSTTFEGGLRLQELSSRTADTVGAEQAQAWRDLIAEFVELIDSWNLEDDDGRDVAPDVAGLSSLGQPEVLQIISAWQTAAAGVPAPLDAGSTSGGPSEALSTLPMETLSGSPAS